MKSLYRYIFERRNKRYHYHKIVVFDIDDTLIRASSDNIYIYKIKGGERVPLTTSQFAVDLDKDDKNVTYDYSEFRDPRKVYDSIVNGEPLLKNLELMDKYINQGYAFCFLTARGLQDVVTKALRKLLRYRSIDGKLKKLGNIFKTEDSAAVNDDKRFYFGDTDGEKKAAVLRKICAKYKEVIFVDDDDRNLQAARNLNIPNLRIQKSLE